MPKNHNFKETLRDRNISYRAETKLNADRAIKYECHLSVATYNRVVLLVGQAPTAALRSKAVDIVRHIPNVKLVYNRVTIEAPSSTLTRSSDSWITTKVCTQLLAKPKLDSTKVKVVTENGTVYLMGLTSRKQARIVVDIARKVSGVQKVVKLFEYTS
ncbi:MAG: BON domain-containing protein [Gammaproteobacteria bacterium]|nr:BON domain-containing protein [Gammaproteobacteria bacterium]